MNPSDGVQKLAAALSVAVRVEAELIRAVRLRVFPTLDVGAESDLWFSDHVGVREPGSIVFRQDARRRLQDELGEMLRAAQSRNPIHNLWDGVISRVHATLPPALWTEEYVTWLAIVEGSGASGKIEAELARALAAFHDGRSGIGDWFAGAYHRLPEIARATPAARELLEASRAQVRMALHRRGDMLDVGLTEPTDGAVAILVPDTEPTLLEFVMGGQTAKMLVHRGTTMMQTVGSGPVRIRTTQGIVYELPGYDYRAMTLGDGRIFVSYAESDIRKAMALKTWLVEQDPSLAEEGGAPLGMTWRDALSRVGASCEWVILLTSKAWESSVECRAEYRMAEYLAKRILPARLEPSAGEIARDWQQVDLFGDRPATEIDIGDGSPVVFSTHGLRAIRDAVATQAVGPETFAWPPPDDPDRSPYRGWQPFEEADAAVYFGRDAQIISALDELRRLRADGSSGLFVILGPSGAGKSSFLRAGLLPRLRRDDRNFVVLDPIRPGRSPLTGDTGLASSIVATLHRLGVSAQELGVVKRACLEDVDAVWSLFDGLQRAAQARMVDRGSPPVVVLPVDQADELFEAEAGAEAARFLEIIGAAVGRAVARQRPQVLVVPTIRTDRYEALQNSSSLAGLSSTLFDDLKPMPVHAIKEIITGPARRATEGGRPLEIEPELVYSLLGDCSQSADALPLLSFTLYQLYTQYGADGDLRLDEYAKLGGIHGVVAIEIDEVLSADATRRATELAVLRLAFIPWLATISPETDQPVRRVARWGDLPTEAKHLLNGLVDRRLLIRDVRGGVEVVEIAAESLLRQWYELSNWLDEERDHLRRADALERDAHEWDLNGRSQDWLLRGGRLAEAEQLVALPAFRGTLAATREFVEASRARQAAASAGSRFTPRNWFRRATPDPR